jgi:hypothetical protein
MLLTKAFLYRKTFVWESHTNGVGGKTGIGQRSMGSFGVESGSQGRNGALEGAEIKDGE